MSGGVAFIALFFTVIIIAYFGRVFFAALAWGLKWLFYLALGAIVVAMIYSIILRWA